MDDAFKAQSQRQGLSFKISPRLIDLFGRELVARTEAAVAELVKNAYDSDAKRVHLKFEGVKNPGGTLIICDNGDGMSLADLKEKWMVIGTRDKLERPRTNRNRRKVGEKGIGRLGAHKLSNRTILKTKKEGESKWIVLDIDWSKYYTDEHSFEEILHPYRTEPGRLGDHGTTLVLQQLRDGFSKENFERLQAELTLLVPPLPGIRDFKIELESDEFPEFKGELKPAILKAANYILDAQYDGKGLLTGTLKVKTESKEKRIDTQVVAPHCGPVRIILYVYVLKRESFEGTPIQLGKVKQVLDIFKGIRIYRDNFKVGVYGDQGDDWLRMDEEHIRAHEVVIHSKQVMGAVHITRDANPDLVDTTNRDRLWANEAFFDLVNVTKKAVDEINHQRWNEREVRDEARSKKKNAIDRAFERIEKAADKDLLVPQDVKEEIRQAVDRVRQEYQQHVVRLEDELQMYRNLASLGISTAAFAHETEAVSLDLELYLAELKDALRKLPSDKRVELDIAFNKVLEAGMRSTQLVDLLLEFVRQRKQQAGPVVLSELLVNLLKRYKPFLERVGVKFFVRSQSGIPKLYCIPMDIEAVFINLLTNAVWAMREAPKRELHFDVQGTPRKIVVTVSDTGPGIDPAVSDKIFMPFFTTKGPKGIGLGLTIAKDTLRQYRGDIVSVIPGTTQRGDVRDHYSHGNAEGASMTALCPFVDDSVNEAVALANQLRRNGVPFDIQPVSPAHTTLATYRLIASAKPSAVLVDYYLTAQAKTDSEELACRLLDHGWPTVILTKDRDVAERVTIRCDGHLVPVYFKHRLINDQVYVTKLIHHLGGQAAAVDEIDYAEQMYALQEKALRGPISKEEKAELRTLLARVRLEETEEAARIEQAQTGMKEGVDSLIGLIRDVTAELDSELAEKHAVSKKRRRS